MEKTISVIIPVYNVAKYLERCLVSVLNSTYKNIEVICIDDGSTDNSLDILNNFAQEDHKVTVIYKDNGGLSSARNSGLEKATGEFVAFIDSDDWIHQRYFSILMDVQQKKDYDVVVCDYARTKEWNGFDFKIAEFDECEMNRNQYISNRKTKSHVWGRLYKRSTLQNILFDEKMKIEDAMYNLEYLHNNPELKAVFIPVPLYGYYQRENSLVSKIDAASIFEIAEKYYQYAESEQDIVVKNSMYIECIKKCLSARYEYIVRGNKEEVKETTILANKGLKKIKGNKSKYVIMVKFPFVYRRFRIMQDPTMLEWEKNLKSKR